MYAIRSYYVSVHIIRLHPVAALRRCQIEPGGHHRRKQVDATNVQPVAAQQLARLLRITEVSYNFV